MKTSNLKNSPPVNAGHEPHEYALTDLGNGERFAAMHGNVARFCRSLNDWFVWDGKAWRRGGNLGPLAKATVRAIQEAASRLNDDEKRRQTLKWGLQSENKIDAMLARARDEVALQIEPTEFDANPWLLNVANGVLDLKTGELLPHDAKHMLTKMAPVNYDPTAPALTWERFLERVQPKSDNRAFLQRLAGYFLTGEVGEHVFPIFWGEGGNGKGTFCEALAYVLGDHAGTVTGDQLVGRKNAKEEERVAMAFLGKRVVLATETERERLNHALIKKLTGGDILRCRWLYGEAFDAEATHKLVLYTNHKPRLTEFGLAMQRRLRLVPWTVSIPHDGEGRDTTLKMTLRAEAPGILAWAVRGCMEWQRAGLVAPEDVKTATAEYFKDEDPLAAFLEDRCERNPSAATQARPLWEAYQVWAQAQALAPGEMLKSAKALGEQLAGKGFKKKKRKGGVIFYDGLELKPHPPSSSPHPPQTDENGSNREGWEGFPGNHTGDGEQTGFPQTSSHPPIHPEGGHV